jgi:hypothetical protein
MAGKNKNNNKISDLLVKGELRPIENMLDEYRHEMEQIKKTLGEAAPAEKKTTLKSNDKKNK